MMTLTIDIPALDRLCGILEGAERNGIAQAIEDEIVRKLKEAAAAGTLEKAAKPEFREVPPDDNHPWKNEAKAEPTAPAPVEAPPTGTPAPPNTPTPVTLDAVQRAAAQLRDAGKLNQVTGMFGEFGIKKLSDLKGDALQGFAERLRQLGAKL